MACKSVGAFNCPDPNIPANPCNAYQLTEMDKRTACYIERVVAESLNIGGATLKIYKLLGVEEQKKLINVAKNGKAISGGTANSSSPDNAFNILQSCWRSVQVGPDDILCSAYIGYDFGVLKLDNGRDEHSREVPQLYNIATVKIKQSALQSRRATRIRLERSDDGAKWYGVGVADLKDNNELQTVHFNSTVRSRYWRIRPVMFNGGEFDTWDVFAVEMSEFVETQLNTIQDYVFMENRDRNYAVQPVTLKAHYDLQEAQTDLSRFGIEMQQQFLFNVSFSGCTALLGRPLVIGDVIELPSETMFDANMMPVRKFVEVTDVGWSSEGYTPGWTPTLLRVTAVPMMATQETGDVFGGLEQFIDDSGLFSNNDGNQPDIQDLSVADAEVNAEAREKVPLQDDDEKLQMREFSEDELEEVKDAGLESTRLEKRGFQQSEFVADAMPPNGADYTEGPSYPDNPKHGDYHRLTYEGTASDIPTRLYRWSVKKNKWIFIESDKRGLHSTKKLLDEFISGSFDGSWSKR